MTLKQQAALDCDTGTGNSFLPWRHKNPEGLRSLLWPLQTTHNLLAKETRAVLLGYGSPLLVESTKGVLAVEEEYTDSRMCAEKHHWLSTVIQSLKGLCVPVFLRRASAASIPGSASRLSGPGPPPCRQTKKSSRPISPR